MSGPFTLVTFDTRHFEFTGLATTQSNAERLMAKAWRLHCKQTGADLDYFQIDCLGLLDLSPGQVFRDFDRLL